MAGRVALKDRSPRWVKDVASVAVRRYALNTVADRSVPDFLIIGTKRGGTTSMWNYLLMHPGVLGLFPRNQRKKSSDYFFRNFGRGESWYQSHFHTERYRRLLERRLGYRPIGGEASPFYVWDPRIAERARAVNPGLKAVMLVRNPVKRAWSHYLERTNNGVEPLSFEEALAVEPARTDGELERMLADPGYYSTAYDWYSYRSRGVYLHQIRNWTSVFPAEQLLILRSEDMYGDIQGTFDTVCDFLGIPRHHLPEPPHFNKSRPGRTMPDHVRAELSEFYGPHVRELETYLGRSLRWSV